MDSSVVGSLLVRTRPTTVVVTPTPTEIVPYKIPSGIVDYVLANRYTGEGHPGELLLYLSQLCSLFKLAGVTMEFVMKKLFSVSLKDIASDWISYSITLICLNGQSLCLYFMQSFIPFVKFTKTGTTSTTFGLATERSSLKLGVPDAQMPKP